MTKTEKQILAWVNRQRVALSIGAPLAALPRGCRNLSTGCPIARALHAEVDNDTVIFDGYAVPNPKYVTAWIEAFDEGKYPHLVEVPREAARLQQN